MSKVRQNTNKILEKCKSKTLQHLPGVLKIKIKNKKRKKCSTEMKKIRSVKMKKMWSVKMKKMPCVVVE